MEPERCLLFFRLVKGEQLLFQQRTETSYKSTLETLVKGTTVRKMQILTLYTNNTVMQDIMVCVDCPPLGIVKKMRVKKDVAFAEILSRFAEKNAIGELGQYEIVLKGSNQAYNPLFKLADLLYHSVI